MSASKHSWFPGQNVAYLLVHRVLLGDRGQQLPGRLVSDKLFVADLPDDAAIRERFGAGRFRVTARSTAGQIAGAPYMVDVPDEMGRVPLYDDPGHGGGASDGGGITLRDLLVSAEKRGEEQRRHYEMLISQMREDRKLDLQFFSSTVDRMSTGFAATQSGGNDRMLDFLSKRLSDVEKRAEGSRGVADELREKLWRKGGESEGVFESIAKGAAPELLAMFTGGGGRRGGGASAEAMEELRAVRTLRERLSRELAEAERLRRSLEVPRATVVQAEGESEADRAARDALGLSVSAAQVAEYLRGGGELSAGDGAQFRALHGEGRLPRAFVDLLGPLGVLDEPAGAVA